MSTKYSILINTTDSFEDCWIPFFTLFKTYWPDYVGKIYLNTETKIFTFPGLDIISIQNSKLTPDKKITWSECLIRALSSIDDEIILYIHEDCFFKDFVKNDLIEKYVSIITKIILGTAPMLIGIFFFGAIQTFFIGVLGEYVASIQTPVRNIPLVVELERVNFQ